MSDEEIEKLYQGMKREFTYIPCPEHEPIRFEYYVKWYKYILSQSKPQ